MRIAVLLACHNRREKTLRCLTCLRDQVLGAEHDVVSFLVDDGSTDGTSEAVRARFPGVRLIRGDGSLFWNQGMRRAWEEAAREDFDAYLWLNDDTDLYPHALETLLETADLQRRQTGREGIVVASVREPRDGSVSFGAMDDRGQLPPVERPVPVRAFNGNCVLVTRGAFRALGNLSAAFRHSFGDVDYGLRAQRQGVPAWVAPGFLAECPGNPPPSWQNPAVPLRQRWRAVHGPKGCPPAEAAVLFRLSYPLTWPLYLMRLYLRVLWPASTSARAPQRP